MTQYHPITAEVIAQLEQVVPGRVVVGEDVNPDYARDEMPIYGTRMPEVSIDVLTTEEVAGIMKVCYEHGIQLPPGALAPAWWEVAPPSAAAWLSVPLK